jgi:hypothetical protein
MHKRRPDGFGMADDDGRLPVISPELLNMGNDPALQGTHAFAARRPAATALAIPSMPSPLAGEIGECRSRPPAHIDFVECRYDLDREPAPGRDNAGRLQSSALRTGLNGLRRHSPDELGSCLHLLAAEFVQLHSRHASAKDAPEKRVMTMPHEVDMRRHFSAFKLRLR